MTEMKETAGPPTTFTAHQAVETLHELEHYEESLTTRAVALTWMFFGIAGGAIFVTYETATHFFIESGVPWLLSFLWVPWIAAAAILTNGLWSMLALQTKLEHDPRETWLATLGGCALVFILAFVVWAVVGSGLLQLDPNAASAWAMVIGAFTAIFATYQSKRYQAPALRTPFVTAGLGLFLTGVGLAAWAPDEPIAGLVAAATSLLVYFAAGLVVYRRG